MNIPSTLESAPAQPRRSLRIVVAFVLLLGTIIGFSTSTNAPEVRAAALTVTATTDTPWQPFSSNAAAVTVSGTTVTDAKSIRVSFTTGSFSMIANQFAIGPCPSWLTATIGQLVVECYISGAMVSLTTTALATIPAGTAFSLVYVAQSINSTADVSMTRTITVGTYDGDQWNTTLIDSGTTSLSWPITVTFDANGGTGTMNPQTASSATALTSNAFTRQGFTFDGWSFWNGGQREYADGASYPFTQARTLYARWLAPSQTVTFDANGGTGTMPPQTASGSTQLSSNLFTLAGHDFIGWKLDTNPGAPDYMNGALYDFSATITLFAVWQAQQQQAPTTYTVTFDSNGGSPVTMGSFTAGGAVSVPTDPTQPGYTFDGWSTTRDDSSTAVNFPYAPPQNTNLTLYALWVAASSTTVPAGAATPALPTLITDIQAAPSTTSAPSTTTPGPGSGTVDGADDGDADPQDVISEERQQQLTAPAGQSRLLVGGEPVEASLVQAPDEVRSVAPADRTGDQVATLQTLANSMLDRLASVLAPTAAMPIRVRNTATGAVIVGLVTDPLTGEPMDIPVEDVVMVVGGGLVLMASGTGTDRAARIGLDGALEIPVGGHVAILAGGLTPGVEGEVVVMSTPRLIGGFAVGASGDVREQAGIPADLELGNHTVVVSAGDDAASLGFRLVPTATGAEQASTDTASVELPTTGVDGRAGMLGALLVALGAGVLAWSTRRRLT